MSLVVSTYIPEGIVMASDSRESLGGTIKRPDGSEAPLEVTNSDSVSKTFLVQKEKLVGGSRELSEPVGISTFGNSTLGEKTIESHIKTFIDSEVEFNNSVKEIGEKLNKFFSSRFPGADTAFHVGGYTREGKIKVPYLFYCHIGKNEFKRLNVNPKNDNVIYGASWGGQSDILTFMLNAPQMLSDDKKKEMPVYPIVWQHMHLQDAVDFVVFAIKTTIDMLRFQARPKNVGGPIDVLVITPDGAKWISKKELHA